MKNHSTYLVSVIVPFKNNSFLRKYGFFHPLYTFVVGLVWFGASLSKLMRKVGRKYNICVSIIFIVFHLVLCFTLFLLLFLYLLSFSGSILRRRTVLLLLLLLLYYINAQALCYIYFDKCSV